MTDELFRVAEDSARGSFFLISGTALSTVILAISAILIGRVLGPELYGQYSLATVVSQLLFLLTDLGINQGITKFTASLNAKGESDRIVRIVESGLILRALVGTILFTVNYVFAETFASFFLQRLDLAFYVRIASISVLFQVVFTTATSAFVGLDKSEYNAIAANVQALAKTIISIVLVILGLSVAGAVIGHTVSYLAAAIAGGVMLYLVLRKGRKGPISYHLKYDLKVLTSYGAPLYVSLLLAGLIPVYQSFMLATFTRDSDIGNFKVASNFAALMAVLSIPIATALLPAFSKLDSSTQDRQRAFFKLANKYTAILVIPVTVLIITYSSEIVHLIYGSTYASAPFFLSTYCTLYFLVGLGYLTLSSFYNGLGETKITMRIGLLTFALTGVLSPLLTQIYSVQGLISAFLIASTAGTVYGSYEARKRFKVEFDTSSLLRIYMISAISAVPSLLMLRLLSLPRVINLVAGVLLYIFIYATLIPLTKTVTFSELQVAGRITERTRLLGVVAKPLLKYEQRIIHKNRNNGE